jgi:hypothetical protein
MLRDICVGLPLAAVVPCLGDHFSEVPEPILISHPLRLQSRLWKRARIELLRRYDGLFLHAAA